MNEQNLIKEVPGHMSGLNSVQSMMLTTAFANSMQLINHPIGTFCVRAKNRSKLYWTKYRQSSHGVFGSGRSNGLTAIFVT